MNKSLATKQETSLADSELIKEAQSLAGESGGTFIPFIPIIRVNNKKEEKEVTVDGKKKKMRVLPDASFTITKKNENTGEYVTTQFAEPPLEGVVLRVRYRINEKFDNKNKTKKLYYSYEFDMSERDIKVYDGNKIIAEGTYQDLKQHFSTGTNDDGFPTKSFDLIMILYVHIDEEVYRFERKVTMNDEWYSYRNKFPRNDTFVAYKTQFLLKKATAGDVEYWNLAFKKGENVDLAQEIEMQKEINKFFKVSTFIREAPKDDIPVIQIEEEEINPTAPEIGEEEPPIEAVPF